MARLDLRSLLQDAAIEEVCTVHCTGTPIYLHSGGHDLLFSGLQVEMEDFTPSEMDTDAEEKKEEEEEADLVGL